MKNKLSSLLFQILFFVFCASILLLSLRGIPGNPLSNVINDVKWKENGPFELSPDRGRFTLMLSLIENDSFQFSVPIARFATPDLGYKDGKYVSLFAPAVSFIIMPGFLIGSYFGLGQVGAFAVIALFALMNAWLIKAIAQRLGAHSFAGALAAMVFLFATPAFTYAVTLYQHHISTFTVLLSIYILLSTQSIGWLIVVWFLFAAGIPIDYPNLFFMFPVALFALGKIFFFYNTQEKVHIKVRLLGILTFVGVILPLLFFFWFNQNSYQNPLQFSGTVKRVTEIGPDGNPMPDTEIKKDPIEKLEPQEKKKSAIGFFRARNLLHGFYVHFVSPDRGVIVYTPIMLLGIGGALILYKRRAKELAYLIGIIAVNILLYSMWADPWGGWAYGSRYLIPTYAILSIFIGIALTEWRKKIIFVIVFLVLLYYSVGVNTLGAITTSRIPPQVEADDLGRLSGRVEKFSFDRTIDYLLDNKSKSFVYQQFAVKYITAVQYWTYLSLGIITIASLLFLFLSRVPKTTKKI